MSVWMILRGMKMLDMRMKKYCENGLVVVEFLEEEENVELVKYLVLKFYF